jgi:RNA polymerase sigma factor (sigma-70 family)
VFLPHLVDAFRLARWIAGSRADAEDIVQEASMRAFKNIRGFSGGNPRAWVLTIVRNTSYSWLAKNRPKVAGAQRGPRSTRARED